jgi:nucleolar complex protein 2
MKSFVGNLLHFLHHTKDEVIIRSLLQHLEPYLIFIATFPRMGKNFMKVLLNLWETGEEHVRVSAFLSIRKLAISVPNPMLGYALKGTYLTYVRSCKFANNQNLPTINFMTNCFMEIYRLDFVSSYQHAFVYIRQLAIHLRNAITHPSKVG